MTDNSEIRPFRIEVAQDALDDLRARLTNTRWPAASRVDGWSRGVPVEYLKTLADYWANGFDWRAQEAALNEIPQFLTDIDGQRVHFFHVRSPEPDALPLILTHGWPSSPVEFVKLIGPLTDPRAHGGDPADAFHVVMPSLPGYGFSNPIGEAGFNLFAVAGAWSQLMSRLGYERYLAQGTDVGSGVGGHAPDGRRSGWSEFTSPARPRGPRSARPSNSTGSRRPTGPGPNSSTASGTTASAT